MQINCSASVQTLLNRKWQKPSYLHFSNSANSEVAQVIFGCSLLFSARRCFCGQYSAGTFIYILGSADRVAIDRSKTSAVTLLRFQGVRNGRGRVAPVSTFALHLSNSGDSRSEKKLPGPFLLKGLIKKLCDEICRRFTAKSGNVKHPCTSAFLTEATFVYYCRKRIKQRSRY